ncbi:MAG TPA: D-alanyl-D-alanine carboxypeptidase/D-alanyl-D-alanine-endopeptidase [Acidiferrobacterales bacterium]
MPVVSILNRMNAGRTLGILGMLVLLPWGAPAADSDRLPVPIAQALKVHRLAARNLSLYVREVGQPEPLLAVNADVPRNPASTMKLLTTLAALEVLGPAYQWRTEAWIDGELADGRLDGNLYIKGYGDPSLVIEQFWRFLRGLRQAGLANVGGDLVVDQSYFNPAPGDPAEFDGRPLRAYNVMPSALLVNFQTVSLRFLPDAAAGRLHITADPHPPRLEVDNRVRLTRGGCRGWGRQLAMRVVRDADVDRVIFTGRYPASCGENEVHRVLTDSTPYVAGVFRALWGELGGSLAGGSREAPVPGDARLLHRHVSPPLADIVRSINKFSNNVMTRQLLLTLGAERSGAPGSDDQGIAALHDWLAEKGLDFPELVVDNGAGLSRSERISARHLAELVQAGLASAYMPEFLASLPLLGMDGTLQRRASASGPARLKTGSLDNVRSLAGVFTDRRGRQYAVAMLHNAPRVEGYAGEAVQDALLEWLDAGVD